MQYLVGADPELFIKNMSTGQFISAHDVIPGSKLLPQQVNYGAIQPDGVSAEFNIKPAKTHEEFSTNVFSVVNALTSIVRNKLGADHSLVATPTAYFDVKYFRKLPAQAKALGCTPDYNVWTGTMNKVVAPSSRRPFRTGAGHIHVGWTEGASHEDSAHVTKCLRVVKQLDACMFVPSLLWDNDGKRRELYGKMGSYRIKPYGVEYRPLSNAWVFKPLLHKFIFETVRRACNALDDGDWLWNDWNASGRLHTIAEGGSLNDLDVLEHYYTFFEKGFCDQMPDEFLDPVENKFLN
jgi:hypothetical protein